MSTESTAIPEDEGIEEFVKHFTDASDATLSARQESEKCRDYVDGKQWTTEETKKLKKRNQPVITDNRIKDKIEHWLGLELSTRTDPKAYPRNPEDIGGADAATDALRYVADANHFQQTKSAVFENILVEGTGGCEVIIEQVKGKPVIKQRRIRWDRMYWDPHSMLPDFSDARYKGIVIWMDVEEAKKKDPKHAIAYDQMIDGTFDWGGTYDDKPTMWIDRDRKRVQILEEYYLEDGKWMRCVFSRAGFIEGPAPAVYLDENGDPECPLEFQSAYVSRDGNRYGVVPRYIPLQDEINHRRSKALHLLTARQIIYEKGAIDEGDINKARSELAKPDGMVGITQGMRFDINPTNDLAIGQFNILKDTLDSLAASGPNSAIQGQEAKESGRAQQIAQQAGIVALGPVLEGLRFWQNRVMRQTWNRIRQFWNEEKWIRVTDNENTRFVALNQKTTVLQAAIQKAQQAGATPEQIQKIQMQAQQDGMADQDMILNATAEMDLDIVIDEAPDTVTLQSEQWLQLTELAKNGVQIKPETLIKASSLNNKEEMIDDIKQQQNNSVPPKVQEEIQKIGEELQKRGDELQKREQALQQAEQQLQQQGQQISQQAQEAAAKLQEQALQLTAERAQFKADVTVAKAEIAAMQKIFAAEQKVASADRKAEKAQDSAEEKSKATAAE